MRSATLAVSTCAVAAHLAAAAPFSFPLPNGFPKLSASALAAVEKAAGGKLPNGPLPTSIDAPGVQTLQLIAANEIFEVAYFTELVNNITNKVSGYEGASDYALQTLTAIVNQEQVHAVGANAILANAGKETIQPCKYQFPVTTYSDAILLAETFTDLVLGVLPAAQLTFATDGGDEDGLIPLIGSILASEAEQVGWYRSTEGKVASAAPILTGAAGQFAYTAISQFIVPGSCPNIDVIGLKAFPALTVTNTPEAYNSTLQFSVAGTLNANEVEIVYISGQNLPVSVPISNVVSKSGNTYFSASFPYDSGFNRGLTIAALVSGTKHVFTSAASVADATINGPALLELN